MWLPGPGGSLVAEAQNIKRNSFADQDFNVFREAQQYKDRSSSVISPAAAIGPAPEGLASRVPGGSGRLLARCNAQAACLTISSVVFVDCLCVQPDLVPTGSQGWASVRRRLTRIRQLG